MDADILMQRTGEAGQGYGEGRHRQMARWSRTDWVLAHWTVTSGNVQLRNILI